MLLRSIHAIKEHATAVSDGSGGILQLPESNISDEEVHALAALLRNNNNIVECNLRNNNITDDGARALGAVLAGKSALRLVDLRGNKIGPGAIRILAEALERAERVKHVYVHQGGKIEALGTNSSLMNTNNANKDSAAALVTVETVCVVDVRDNNASGAQAPYELEQVNDKPTKSASAPTFAPAALAANMTKTMAASAALLNAAAKEGGKKKKKKEDVSRASSGDPAAMSLKQQKQLQKKVS
jgi:hypothetical protein